MTASQSSTALPEIIQVNCSHLYQRLLAHRAEHYAPLFPGIQDIGKADPYDFGARIWATLDSKGFINSSVRLVLDGPAGLPSETLIGPCLAPLRDQGLRMAEIGRLIVGNVEAPTQLSRRYYSLVWAEALCAGVDTLIMVARQSKQTLYIPYFGAHLLCTDIGEDFGSGTPFTLFRWDVRNTAPAFFTWAGLTSTP